MKKILFILMFIVSFGFSTVLWDGAIDESGRVETGIDDGTDTYGYWYSYTDADNAGTSSITYPEGVVKDAYDNFFGPLTIASKGIKASFTLTGDYQYPFIGFGFNLTGENKGAADITCWDGLIVSYNNSVPMTVEIGIVDEKTVTGYDNYVVKIPAGSGVETLPWSKFAQNNWGTAIPLSKALTTANGIKFKFGGSETDVGLIGDVFISKIETISDCTPIIAQTTPITPIITPTIEPSVAVVQNKSETIKFNYINNVVTINKVISISVYDINGIKIMSNMTNKMDLNRLNPGMYFIEAHGIHKVIVK